MFYFSRRSYGLSKTVAYLRSNYRKMTTFSLVGAGVFAAQFYLLLGLVNGAMWNPTTANIMAQLFGVAANYWFNKRYTWTEVQAPGTTERFFVARLFTAALAALIFNFLLPMGHLSLGLCQSAGVIVGMVVNWFVADRWVFVDHRPDYQSEDELEKLQLGKRTGIGVVVSVVAALIVLRLLAGQMFVPLVLTALSLMALSVALLFLVSMLYPHRDHESAETLKLRAPTGVFTTKIASLHPAWKEVAVFAETLITTAFNERDHPHTMHRFFPCVVDKDPDTVRVAIAASRLVNDWARGKIKADSAEELLAAYVKPELPYIPSVDPENDEEPLVPMPLTEAEWAQVAEWQAKDVLMQPVIYSPEGKSSKARQMNFAMESLGLWDRFDVCIPFDAEDAVQEGLFAYIDQGWQDRNAPDQPGVDILQGAVQLMPPKFEGTLPERFMQGLRKWYAYHNVLEYYRWFSGQMRFQSDRNVLPLGGNTVVLSMPLLKKIGGYLDTLAEDCSTGMLLTAVHGARTGTFYMPHLTTREKVPPSLAEWRNQRKRWNQGFIQALLAGHWKALPTSGQRSLALWILTCPFFQAISAMLLPLSLVTMFLVDSPPMLVLVMFLPVFAMCIVTVLQIVQLHDLGRDFSQKIPLHAYANIVVTQALYQFMLSIAALGAVIRYIKGDFDWHRTAREEEVAAQKAAQPVEAVQAA